MFSTPTLEKQGFMDLEQSFIGHQVLFAFWQNKTAIRIKLTSFREEFMVHLKKWKFDIWPFRSCKTFETNLGFIN